MDGDVTSYIGNLAEIVFRSIRNTRDWYSGSFADTTMASGKRGSVCGVRVLSRSA
jgi:hypothetical protein